MQTVGRYYLSPEGERAIARAWEELRQKREARRLAREAYEALIDRVRRFA